MILTMKPNDEPKMKGEKKFIPRPGQTDFTDIRWAPVINCVLRYGDEILLMERSKDLKLNPGCWSGISGFLDDNKSLEEKVLEEIREEVGISKEQVISIKPGKIFDEDDPKYKKTWIVHPVLVEVNTDKVQTDWEAQNYRWVTLAEAWKMDYMSGFDKVLKALFKFDD